MRGERGRGTCAATTSGTHRARSRAPRVRAAWRRRAGLAKQFDLSYEEVMPLNAMYDVEQCAHRLCADARILLDCVHNLPHTEHELMLSVTPSELIVKNDVDDSAAEKSVRTEMSVAPADLQEWSIGALATQPLRISFATKEFKAMLHLAESSGTPISAHFDQGGKPLIVAAHVGDGPERVRLECVIATLIDQSAAADELFGDDGEFGAAYNPQQLGVSTPSQSQPDGGMCARDGEQVDSAFAPTYNAASAQPFGVTCSGGGERVRACGTGSQPAAETAAMRNIADTINSLSRLCPDEQLLQQPQQPPRATDPISSFPASRQMAASGRTAAERAHEALEVLPAAPGVMQASPSAGDAVRAGHRPTLALAGAPDGSDTDNDDDAVGATPPDSPPSKRPCAGFVEQFALPTGPSCRTLA